ncbi:M3 family metallopeptidase [bacterium]|nr:M3 family metallopeptidase [bacterium]
MENTNFAKWDITNIYSCIEDPKIESDKSLIKTNIEKLSPYTTKIKDCTISSSELDQSFLICEDVSKGIRKLFAYAMLNKDTQIKNNTAQSFFQTQQLFINDVTVNHTLFFNSLKKMDNSAFDALLNDAAIPQWKNLLSNISKGKEFTLNDDEEKVIQSFSPYAGQAWSRFYDEIESRMEFGSLEIDGKEVQLTESKIKALMSHPDQKTRLALKNRRLDTYKTQNPFFAYTYKNVIGCYQTDLSKLRKADHVMTFSGLHQEVEPQDIENLFDVSHNNIPLFQKYHSLKKKLLNLEEYTYADFGAPLSSKKIEVSYDQAKSWLLDSLDQFSPEYATLAKDIFDQNKVDTNPMDGKQSGAYCMGTGEHGSYILMSYQDDYDSMFTLAHEMGHAVHQSLYSDAQSPLYHNCTLVSAETASQLNELILLDYLLEKDELSDEDKILVLDEQIGSLVSVLFRQTMISEFEFKCHKESLNKVLSADDINQIWYDLVSSRNGDLIKTPENEKYGWSIIPHMFHVPFYCWTYAMSMLVVLALFQQYRKNKEAFLPGYLEILKAGSSSELADLLKDHLNLDIHDPKFLQSGFDFVSEYVDELEKLVSK